MSDLETLSNDELRALIPQAGEALEILSRRVDPSKLELERRITSLEYENRELKTQLAEKRDQAGETRREAELESLRAEIQSLRAEVGTRPRGGGFLSRLRGGEK